MVEEEVPSSHEAKCVIDPFPRKSDEAATDGHVDRHLGHAVVTQRENDRVDGKRQQKAARPGTLEGAAHTDEDGRAYGTPDGDELELAVAEATVEAIADYGYFFGLGASSEVVGGIFD